MASGPIVVSFLITFSHLLFNAQIVDVKPDTGEDGKAEGDGPWGQVELRH